MLARSTAETLGIWAFWLSVANTIGGGFAWLAWHRRKLQVSIYLKQEHAFASRKVLRIDAANHGTEVSVREVNITWNGILHNLPDSAWVSERVPRGGGFQAEFSVMDLNIRKMSLPASARAEVFIFGRRWSFKSEETHLDRY